MTRRADARTLLFEKIRTSPPKFVHVTGVPYTVELEQSEDPLRVDHVWITIEAPPFGFAIVNLESNNAGMRWDIAHTRRVTGYVPLDSATPVINEDKLEEDRIAREKRLVPGQWFDEDFNPVKD